MRGYSAVGLYHPKNPINVGGVLRAAHCFGAAFVAMEGPRWGKSVRLGGIPTDVHRYGRGSPLITVDRLHDLVPHSCQAIAIEVTGDVQLHHFVHPHRALYIFGPEDGSLGDDVLTSCQHVVRVPTIGCLNLAATVNVVLYDRLAKRGDS